MSEWVEKRLGDMIAVNPIVKLTKGEIYPFIDIDKVERQNKLVTNVETRMFDGQGGSRFQSGDTVFSRITPCLENRKIAQVKLNKTDAGFGSTEFFVFRHKKGLTNPNFIYYFVSSDWVVLPAINSMTGASGRQRADRKFVENLKISFPPLPTQTRIADILSAYDDAIENNNRRIELLEKAARELYREWFVRFRFPGHDKARFVNGLPEGWERVKFKGNISYFTGKLDSNEMVTNGQYNFYTCAKTIYKTDSYCFDGECVLLGGNNATGDFSLFYANEKLDAYQRTYIVTPLNNRLSCPYIFFVLDDYLYHFKVSSTGAATKFLTKRMLDNFYIVLPSRQLSEEYYQITKTLFDEKINLQSKSQNLARQRDLLLPRLMSGELEV